ncbi:mitotic spindle assembly checkpoint protein MAD2B [Diabrotica undecimpunctata]|uniref:mitotic spindle assembly checkpoint protein MAD2B n=1 Tax=Diabrotica undecimpunctata TaxID=50387 RepID=UPI003B63AA93
MSVKLAPSDILCEFLEVVIHNIVYIRKLYPETIFSRKRKYGVVVYQCIQPDVNNYITEVLKSVSFHSKKSQLKTIFICFFSAGSVQEKYVLEILNLKNIIDADPLLIDLEQCMRNFILRLHNTINYLDDLSEDATFSVQLQVTTYSNLEFNQTPNYDHFPWVEVNKTENICHSADIVPVHTIESDIFNLQIYIEKPN